MSSVAASRLPSCPDVSLTTKVLLALSAGLVAGLLIQPVAAGAPFAQVLVASEAVGTLWVNAIRMTVVPLVLSLLITGVSTAADARIVRSVGVRALVTFIGLLTLSLVVGLLYVPLLFTWLDIDPATSEALRANALQGAKDIGAATQGIPTFSQFLVNLVPTNPVKAAADGAMLPLVVFAIAFGLALLKVDDEVRAPVL